MIQHAFSLVVCQPSFLRYFVRENFLVHVGNISASCARKFCLTFDTAKVHQKPGRIKPFPVLSPIYSEVLKCKDSGNNMARQRISASPRH